MTDRPIIFSAPMVRALLREVERPGTGKTQTRRVLKPQPVPCLSWGDPPPGTYPSAAGWSRLPYAPGDRLWVREAWRALKMHDDLAPRDINPAFLPHITYDASEKFPAQGRSRHARFMPRWASRLTLTVTDVRVQRLQEIRAIDVQAEGACELAFVPPTEADEAEARAIFRDLWNSLHGPGAWGANPWVAAITFTVRKGNIDEVPA